MPDLENLTATALLFAVGLFGATAAWAADPVVFAAASTKDAITDIANDFAAAGKGKSSLLRLQRRPRQADRERRAGSLFISADTKWTDYLDEKKLHRAGSRTTCWAIISF